MSDAGDKVQHPGEFLVEQYLKPRGITQTEAARRLDVPLNRLNEIVTGKRGITPDTALRLERVLGFPAGSWLALQSSWDLDQARRSPNAEVIRRLRRLKATAAAVDSTPSKRITERLKRLQASVASRSPKPDEQLTEAEQEELDEAVGNATAYRAKLRDLTNALLANATALRDWMAANPGRSLPDDTSVGGPE